MKEAQADRIERMTRGLFWLGLGMEVLAVVFDKSSWTNPYQSLMFRAAFVLFGARCLWALLRRCYSRRELLVIALAAVIAVISWRCSGRNELIRFLAFVCALRSVKIRRAAKFVLYTTLAGSLVIIALAAGGVLGHCYTTMDYGGGIETRWDLGFGHPNSLHCMALMLMLLVLYLYERQMKMYIYVLLFVGNFLLYSITKSNTAFLVGSAALILSAILHYSERLTRSRLPYLAGGVLLTAVLAFSVYAATHDPRKDQRLLAFDTAYLSGRIASLWETVFHEGTLSTWKLFGSRFNTYYFDMGWVRLVYWYGIIPALLTLALVFVLLRRIRIAGDRGAFVMLIAMLLYSVVEAHLISEFIGRNYLLFLVAWYLPQAINGEEAVMEPASDPERFPGGGMAAGCAKETGSWPQRSGR